MRKYRGKRVDNGEWVHGWYHELDHPAHKGKAYIIPSHASALYSYEVDPKTVGQYTGLQKVYEKDILKVTEVSNRGLLEYVSRVEFFESVFIVTQPDGTQVPLACFHNLDSSYPLFEIEVIGNVIDNPELLEGTG